MLRPFCTTIPHILIISWLVYQLDIVLLRPSNFHSHAIIRHVYSVVVSPVLYVRTAENTPDQKYNCDFTDEMVSVEVYPTPPHVYLFERICEPDQIRSG